MKARRYRGRNPYAGGRRALGTNERARVRNKWAWRNWKRKKATSAPASPSVRHP